MRATCIYSTTCFRAGTFFLHYERLSVTYPRVTVVIRRVFLRIPQNLVYYACSQRASFRDTWDKADLMDK